MSAKDIIDCDARAASGRSTDTLRSVAVRITSPKKSSDLIASSDLYSIVRFAAWCEILRTTRAAASLQEQSHGFRAQPTHAVTLNNKRTYERAGKCVALQNASSMGRPTWQTSTCARRTIRAHSHNTIRNNSRNFKHALDFQGSSSYFATHTLDSKQCGRRVWFVSILTIPSRHQCHPAAAC